MTTCISRRACADRFTMRLTNAKGEIGKHIWTEYRCPNVVTGDTKVCVECSYKLPKYKYQANPKFDHGHVGGQYPADSKLYGSPYYLKELKDGWLPSEADELRAKAAVDKATSEMPAKKKIEIPEVTPVDTNLAIAEPVRQKRKYTKKVKITEVTDIQTAKVDTPKVQTPKVQTPKVQTPKVKTPKIKTPKLEKPSILLPQTPVLENPLEPKFIEMTAAPIAISDFVVVKVKKIKCQGKDYYYDSASGKLYGVSVNGVGAYKGRFNKDEETIDVTFPDSDYE